MLRLTEVASQSETFSKRVLEKTTSQSTCLHGWPNPATTAECFLLTGRLYWLFDCASMRNGLFRQLRLDARIIIPPVNNGEVAVGAICVHSSHVNVIACGFVEFRRVA